MGGPSFLATAAGRKIAYHKTEGRGPGVLFLGGFKSDMDGIKAHYLQNWAQRNERAFIRFDYSGHGISSGQFEDGSIGDWAEDAMAVLCELADGPQILVGSSMGGWISAILMRNSPQKLAGFVGIAAAPDFTEDSMWAGFDAETRAELHKFGQISLPSEYDEPYVITGRLIEEGRNNLVLRAPIAAPFPVRLLQGCEDADVDQSVALRFLNCLEGPDIRLTLVKGADHRFSEPRWLAMIVAAIDDIIESRSNA